MFPNGVYSNIMLSSLTLVKKVEKSKWRMWFTQLCSRQSAELYITGTLGPWHMW